MTKVNLMSEKSELKIIAYIKEHYSIKTHGSCNQSRKIKRAAAIRTNYDIDTYIT